MTAALLYLSGEASRPLATTRVAGSPLALRAMVAAARAGAALVGVPARLRTPDLERRIARVRGLAAVVRWIEAGDPTPPPPVAGGPCLLVPAAALVDPGSVRALLALPAEGSGAALAESVGTRAPVLVATPDLVASLWPRLAGGEPVGADLDRALEEARPKLVSTPGPFVAAGEAGDLARIESLLLARLGTDGDCGVDRFGHRRASRLLTRRLARTWLTPNQVSLASLAVGLGAIWCFWNASPGSAALGVVLYAIACVVDHADGELARLTFQESHAGALLDWAIDTVIHSTLILAMGVTAGGALMVAAGLLGAVGVTLSAFLARHLPHEIELGPTVGGVLRHIGNRDLFYMVLLGFVLLRWLSPGLLPVLVTVVAAGSQGYWVACAARIRRSGPAGP
jgi:phosphatidylglycerophosphate synthase